MKKLLTAGRNDGRQTRLTVDVLSEIQVCHCATQPGPVQELPHRCHIRVARGPETVMPSCFGVAPVSQPAFFSLCIMTYRRLESTNISERKWATEF